MPPADPMLVRALHLMGRQTGGVAVLVVVAAALVDASGLLPFSRPLLAQRFAADLVCVGAFQAVAHFLTLGMRRCVWGWLRWLPPRDVAFDGTQSFTRRLASRIASAALLPAFCIAALVLGGPGAESFLELSWFAVLAIGGIGIVATVCAIQIGQIAERDVLALSEHLDNLFESSPIDAGTASEWGEQPMSTRAAVELADAIHMLAAHYSRLACEEDRARRAVEEAHMLRTRFMAYMSHDLRSPLNSITGFAEVLAMESEGPLN
ncbi:MAG: hypothetical protein H5U40_05520, partial [Polyangiaceae bacterium]|nr:hypothetical protein [Polyangiaceae bacterium]